MLRNFGSALVFTGLVFLIGSCHSYKVRLEGKDDQTTGAWKKISCRYIQGHSDYTNATGCRIDLYPLNEEYFKTTVQETWGVCSQTTCDFIYYDGNLPKPKTVTVKALVGGAASIAISSKKSLLIPDFTVEDTFVPEAPGHPEFEMWREQSFDISDSNFVIGLTVNSPDAASVALVDYIELDFGDDVTPPPTTPPTTEPPPKSVFEVDMVGDLTKEFSEVSCNYVEHIDELWVWGCPRDVAEEEGTGGYWAPCRIPSCYFIFNVGSSSRAVSAFKLDGIFRKGASIKISKTAAGLGAASREIVSQELTQDQRSLTFNLYEDCDDGKFNISINGAKGLAMIDRLTVHLQEDEESPCATGNPGPGDETTEKDDGGDPEPPNPDGSAAVLSSLLLCSFATAMVLGVFSIN